MKRDLIVLVVSGHLTMLKSDRERATAHFNDLFKFSFIARQYNILASASNAMIFNEVALCALH